MELGLRGKVAVVTGGASGIGLASVRALAEEGCNVSVWDRARCDEHSAAQSLVTDVTRLADAESAARQTEAALGPISILVHAAAIGSGKYGFPFTNLDPGDWPRVLEVNVMGMVHVAHSLAPAIKRNGGGSMVFLASVAGQIGSQTDPPYSASKAANINFAQCLAKDLAPHNVRVNVVNPGMVRTPLNHQVWQAWEELQPPERHRTYEEWAGDKIRNLVPLQRWQEPEDIANAIVFLSSERARQITGQTINVDGGQVMHW